MDIQNIIHAFHGFHIQNNIKLTDSDYQNRWIRINCLAKTFQLPDALNFKTLTWIWNHNYFSLELSHFVAKSFGHLLAACKHSYLLKKCEVIFSEYPVVNHDAAAIKKFIQKKKN